MRLFSVLLSLALLVMVSCCASKARASTKSLWLYPAQLLIIQPPDPLEEVGNVLVATQPQQEQVIKNSRVNSDNKGDKRYICVLGCNCTNDETQTTTITYGSKKD